MKRILCVLILIFSSQVYARRVLPGEMLWNMTQLTTEASYDIAISQDNMPLTITGSGTYTFAESLTGSITIAADNVVLDLNGHQLNGSVSTSGFTNIIVRNGFINQPASAVCMTLTSAVDVQVEDIEFSNGTIGIDVTSTGTNILINNCSFRSQTSNGIRMDNIHSPQVMDCTFNQLSIPGTGLGAVLRFRICRDVYAENIDIAENQFSGGSAIQFLGTQGAEVTNCRIRNNSGTATYLGISILNIASSPPIACTINNCLIQNNTSTTSFFGINGGANANSVVVKNCIISDNTAGSSLNGISFNDSEDGVIENNKIINNVASSAVIGINLLALFRFSIINNIIKDNTGDPLVGNAGIIEDGTSSDNFVFNNEVRNNSGTGITKAGTDSYFLGNISSKNTVANYSGVPVGTVNIVTYDISAGTYNTTPVATSNIDAIP